MNTFRHSSFSEGVVRLSCADIVTAFNSETVGSRVIDVVGFMTALARAIPRVDFASQRVPGQALIELPEAISYVSPGVGRRSKDPNDYVTREWRGHVGAYLLRAYAANCEALSVVVYTLDAYLADPDCFSTEANLMRQTNPTHVIVAVLGTAGPKPAYSPRTLVRNLAGANHEALLWTADEIRQKARESMEYEEAWATVSD